MAELRRSADRVADQRTPCVKTIMSRDIAIGFLILAILLGCTVQFLGRFIMTYRLGEEAVKVQLFNLITVVKIRYHTISSIELLEFRESYWPTVGWRFANRIIYKKAVLISRCKIIFCRFLITPDDPDSFASELSIKVAVSRSPSATVSTTSATTKP